MVRSWQRADCERVRNTNTDQRKPKILYNSFWCGHISMVLLLTTQCFMQILQRHHSTAYCRKKCVWDYLHIHSFQFPVNKGSNMCKWSISSQGSVPKAVSVSLTSCWYKWSATWCQSSGNNITGRVVSSELGNCNCKDLLDFVQHFHWYYKIYKCVRFIGNHRDMKKKCPMMALWHGKFF